MSQETNDRLVTDTVDIVSSYVANNPVPVAELPKLISTVRDALAGLGAAGSVAVLAESEIEKPTAAQIRKSIRPDAIVSFIDGKGYKTLKRHLTKHGLDPQGYRARYGLPDDYPMTSAAYSAQRSELAKATGLGVPGSRKAA